MSQSVNDIQLTGLLIEGLYRKSLVLVEDGRITTTETIPPAPQVRFLGNNEKNVTILVNDPGSTFLPEGHLSFLTKILGACKLNIGDVAIVNVAHNSELNEIIKTLAPSKMITFGSEIEIDGIEHVKAPSIDELIPESPEAKAHKSKLWSGLKKMFAV
jgi:hypothetical protein